MQIQGRPKSVFKSNLIHCQIIVFIVCYQYDFVFASNDYITKSIADLWAVFYCISSVLIFMIVFYLLRLNNSTLAMPDAIEHSSPVKTYSPLMTTGILLFTLVFSGAAALSATKLFLDLTIKFASSTPVQFKTTVDDEFESHSRRGGCYGTEYGFNNPSVSVRTFFCDRDHVLSGVKEGDTILVNEKMSFAGAQLVSAERVPNQSATGHPFKPAESTQSW